MMFKAWRRLVKIILLPEEVMGRASVSEFEAPNAKQSAAAKPLNEPASR